MDFPGSSSFHPVAEAPPAQSDRTMTSDGDDDAPEPLEPADDATRTHAGRSDETVTHLPGLLGWVHSGFSVHGEPTVPTEDPP